MFPLPKGKQNWRHFPPNCACAQDSANGYATASRYPFVIPSGMLPLMWHRFERSRAYRPKREWVITGAALARPWEDLYFSSGDGVRLNAWYFPANPDSPHREWAVLLCHGNGGNVSHRLGTVALLLELGLSVLVFDYRGYGRSEGIPSEAGTYLDAQAAFAWLRQRGFAAAHIIAFGESLGGGVATELATRETVGGLVLQSTFTSLPDAGADLFPWLPVRWLSRLRYDSRAKLAALTVPVLVLHSRADRLVPFHHAERNFATLRGPRLLRETQGDHNDSIRTDLANTKAALGEFLGLLKSG